MKIQETSLEHHIGLHSALLSKERLTVFMCLICSKNQRGFTYLQKNKRIPKLKARLCKQVKCVFLFLSYCITAYITIFVQTLT